MPFQQHIPFLSIFISMMGGVIGALLKKPKAARTWTLITVSTVVVLSGVLIAYLISSGTGSFVYNAGHVPAPWGNTLKSGLMEPMVSLVFGIVIIFSILGGVRSTEKDIEDSRKYYFYLMINILFASLLALTYTNDMFTAYVFLEINTIAAISIVVAKESGDSLRAAIKYFIMSALGSGLYLYAVSMLYSITGHLAMPGMSEGIQKLMANGNYHYTLSVALVLMFVALAVKSALFPFHGWLPDAYGSSTTSASAILSGVASKGYMFLFVKIVYSVFTIDVVKELKVLPIILALGLAAMIIGSLLAILQKDLKKMIAYSSVAQIGYIFTGIGLGTTAGMVAAVFHIMVHSLTKSTLFLAAGSYLDETGDRRISKINGAGALMPIVFIVFAIGGLSMIGIPPSIGFSSKWNFAEAMMNSEYSWTIILLSLSSLLNALYYMPIILKAFFSKETAEYKAEGKTVKRSLLELTPIIILGVLIIAIGLFSGPIVQLIRDGLMSL